MNFQGTEYAVSDQVFEQFKAGYEQAQKQSADKGNQQSLATLGIDPRRWLTDPKNEGEAKVGDTDTIKITGGVDVDKLLDDVNTALEQGRAASASRAPTSCPRSSRTQQKQQAADAIKDLDGRDLHRQGGHDLRRMVVDIGVEAPESGRRDGRHAHARLLSCSTSTRTRRSRRPPTRSRSTSCSASSAGSALGGSGGVRLGLGRLAARAPAARPRRTSRSTPTASTEAGSDTAKAQKCAELLSP